MKILFIVESYYPKTSGVPVVTKYLAEGLAKNGNDVSVVTTMVNGRCANETFNNVHIYRINLRKTLLKRYVGDIKEYRQFVISMQADAYIFECSECVTTDVLLPILPQLRGKKIFHSHGFSGMLLKPFLWNVNLKYTIGNTYNWLRFKWYYKFYFKRMVQYFDATMCLSEIDSSRKWLEKNSKKVVILQNAVDEIFLQPTTRIQIRPFSLIKKPYLVSVATYSKQKNQINILREFFKVKSECALIFVGPVETQYYNILKAELDRLQSTSNVKREVYLLLKIDRSEIPNVIGNAALYLCGSLFEEYSISLIEAMAKGIPFISTNVGNARILPGGVTLKSISDMNVQIDRLLSDKQTYHTLSEAGRKFVNDNCRREKAVELLENTIKEV